MSAVVPNLPSPDVVRAAKKMVHFPDIIADPVLKQLFIDFLEAEMMHENFLFWLDVEEFKTIEDHNARIAFFEHIYNKYLGPNAELEMCIAGRRRAYIDNNRSNPPLNVFDNVQHDVFIAMSQECVPRFCRSEIYLSYLVSKPDSPRTRFSRQKLQEFFGMEIDGLLYRVELVQVVSNPGFERSGRKRKRQKKDPHLRKMGDKLADPTKENKDHHHHHSHSGSSISQGDVGGGGGRRGERK
eukprot:CAMPEP_0201506740 /NCGR_PEP_ID=MMETSP0161_2-20130828/591_1 /ASSEMBLY_ACC=CAM_ASM_000251 /TAXON_ID=180227 /ORGANISM="Neoparamoeba aestuarina, Strain SoJaBio B1-5/56/2" /LENGTH=240 /DNA_ID=CAMNT_0047900917 /DNA_START=439 /DNA_END=1161 /DNA_ORIENTATION=-